MTNSFSYYHRLWQIYRSYQRRDIRVSPLPLRMWVELCSDCNLRCVMCPNKELQAEQRGFMSMETFRKVVDEAAGFIYEMALHHRGESLKHPQATEMIAYAARRIPVTKLHTNGTLLDEKTCSGLVDSRLTRISFSFDGFTKEEYEKIRVGADFDQTVANIKTLLRIRREKGSSKPEVAIEMIKFNNTQVEKEKRERFVREFKSLGVDQFIFKKPHNWAGHLRIGHSQNRYAPCTFLWNALLILWNGDVSPCAQDFFATYILGNVNRQSLKEIWNGEPQRRLRQALSERRHAEFTACRDCDRLWRDTFLGIPREYLRQILFRRMP